MKINIFSAIAISTLMFVSCTDDSDYNNDNTVAGVTVEMKSASFSSRENGSVYQVPFVVSGEPNGDIIVEFEATPVGVEPAKADVNYYATSYTFRVTPEINSGFFEFVPIDDDSENVSRTFDVTIKNVKGATIGSIATTTIEIKDDETDPYLAMEGQWIFAGYNISYKDDDAFYVNIELPDENTEADLYGTQFRIWINDLIFMPADFEYNELTGAVKINLLMGELCNLNPVEFDFGYANIRSANNTDKGGPFGDNVAVDVTLNDRGLVSKFVANNPSDMWIARVYQASNNEYVGRVYGWSNLYFVKP